MQTAIPLPVSEVFTSWKEIASYLNKGVRTVQRWESEFGLPVRRPRDRARGFVQASREDLDRWNRSQWAVRARRAKANSVDEFQRHQALRLQNAELVHDISKSLEDLVSECKSLRAQVESSQAQRLALSTK